MSGGIHIRAIHALSEQQIALRTFAEACDGVLASVARAIATTQQFLDERRDFWRQEVARCEIRLEQAEAALTDCLDSGYTDEDDEYHAPTCSIEREDVFRAAAALDDARERLMRVERAILDLADAHRAYRVYAEQQRAAVEDDIPSAIRYLEYIIVKVQEIATLAIPRSLGLAAVPFGGSANIAAASGGGGAAATTVRPMEMTPEIAHLHELVETERVADRVREHKRQEKRDAETAMRNARAKPPVLLRTVPPDTAPLTPHGGHPEAGGSVEQEPSPEAKEGVMRGGCGIERG